MHPRQEKLLAAELKVSSAAVLWVADQQCASALASLEDAVEELLDLRAQMRRERTSPPLATE